MSEVLLNHEVIVYLLSEFLLYGLLFISAFFTLTILRSWNFSRFDTKQFVLENRSYLVGTIITVVLSVKMLLLPYFVHTIDSLADLVPGAMCAAGVIKANSYGNLLLVLKVVSLFLSGIWLSMNRLDLEATSYPYMKLKSWFFLVIFILLSIEFVLDIAYFTHIQTNRPVSCCSVIFGQLGGANALPFGLDSMKLLLLYYLLYGTIVLSMLSKRYILAALLGMLFSVIAYYAVVYFFGTYVYALPTHKCPFCMLQSAYDYVGYAIWGSLLLGLFFLFDVAVLHTFFHVEREKLKRVSLLFLTLFIVICSAYVAVYYFKNGVLL